MTAPRPPANRAPIASITDLRAAMSALPRVVQAKVRLLWRQGHMSAAIDLVEAANVG